MLNHYPIWKNLLLAAVMVIAVIYALPNLYPEDPSVQISHDSGDLPTGLQAQVESALSENNIVSKAVEVNELQQLLVRFDKEEKQLAAADELKSALGSNHVVALNLAPAVPQWLKGLNASPMNLGLDLRGGVHFLLQVDMNAAVKKALDGYEDSFRNTLRENKVRYSSVNHDGDTITVKFRDQENYTAGLDELKDEFRADVDFTDIAVEKGFALQAAFKQTARLELQTFAVQQNITTLRKRVNELGVAEPVIQRQGQDRIVVQLPGVQDTNTCQRIVRRHRHSGISYG